MRLGASLLLVVSLTSSATLAAEPDCDGCKDHPQVQRFPGFRLSQQEVNDFNTVAFKVADDRQEQKEGHSWSLTYGIQEGARSPSCAESTRNYENAFKKGGGRLVWRSDDWCQATVMMPLGKGERWMSLDNNVRGNGSLNMTLVELAPMEQKVKVNDSDMLESLNRNGYVSLYGIYFDTGKADIKPESEGTLADVVKLLQANASLKLIVAGHTDNVGAFASNMDLSKGRANAVVKALVAKGVSASRLNPQGLGQCAPVASNDSEEGRARNRRVELVKQ